MKHQLIRANPRNPCNPWLKTFPGCRQVQTRPLRRFRDLESSPPREYTASKKNHEQMAVHRIHSDSLRDVSGCTTTAVAIAGPSGSAVARRTRELRAAAG